MKRSIRFYLYFTVIAIFCSEGFALDPTKSLLQYGRDVWQAKDGFTPFAIHALHQTRDGYLWIGTDEGLVRFDGTQFTTFNKANTKELLVNAIVSLSEDDEGQLWMGTLGSGVLKYKNGIFTRFDTSTGLPTNNIFSIFVDSRNTVWAGMLNYGYAELQDGKWKSHTARADFQFNNVHYISENIKHELWFGFGNIGKKNKGSDTLQYYTIPKSGIIHTICFLDDGTPLFGHREEIYTLVNDSVRLFFNEEISLGGNIRCLLRDRRGNLWIASEGGGLFRYTNGV
ncbi:MAG: hypothetical protein KGZ58_07080, partial [Ignavibacteriales bacterium]|nr:hypothetical protein [Ignavibacteriales bacterium]